MIEPEHDPTPSPRRASRTDQVLALVRLGLDAAALINAVQHETPVEAAGVIAQHLQQWAWWISRLRTR